MDVLAHEHFTSDFLERWNWQASSVNVQLHAIAASDDAVDVLAHKHFKVVLHLNMKGYRCLLRGITDAIYRCLLRDITVAIGTREPLLAGNNRWIYIIYFI